MGFDGLEQGLQHKNKVTEMPKRLSFHSGAQIPNALSVSPHGVAAFDQIQEKDAHLDQSGESLLDGVEAGQGAVADGQGFLSNTLAWGNEGNQLPGQTRPLLPKIVSQKGT